MIQAVILARGLGMRQRPLTFTRPKPILEFGGTTILEHTLEALSGLVGEVIFVVGAQEEDIQKQIGSKFQKIKIRYVRQEKPLGTGDALYQARPYLREKFLVMNGDDFYTNEDIGKVLKKFPSILVQEVENPSSFGVVFKKGELMEKLVEKPKKSLSHLANTGLYFLDKQVFETTLEKSERGEFELTQAIEALAQKRKMFVVEASHWIPISYPWDLLTANQFLLEQQKGSVKEARIEKGVVLKGEIILGAGTVVKSGSYLEGPLWIGSESQIGPNAYLRPATMIGSRCRIGANVEVKNSIIGDGTHIDHLSYVGDSILGHDCHLGAGTIIANLRFDQKLVEVEVKGEMVSTRRKKFGAVLGDGVKVGVNSSLMPGVLIDPEVIIGPHSLVKNNLKNSKFIDEKKH